MTDLPQKPKIAFLNSDLWMGGGAIFVLELSAELARRGLECEVFIVRDLNYLAADFRRENIKVSSESSAGTIYEDRIQQALERMKAYGPTIIVAGAEGECCEVLRYVPRDIPRIGVFHLVLPETLELAHRYRHVLDHAVAVSNEVARSLRESLPNDSLPIRTLELGIHRDPTFRPREFPPKNPLKILYLGRLEDPAKRVRRFREIFNHLKSSGIPFLWNIAGAGPEQAYLEQNLVSNEPLQQVRFLGAVPHSKVPGLLAENDVFLLTSDSESFCLSLHEAMAAGLVPVSSAIPGRVGELVDGTTGIAVPPDQPAAYAEAIVSLHFDRSLMVRMSAAARARIGAENSIEEMGNRWMSFLTELRPRRGVWPDRWRIEAPLHAPNHFLFSLAIRSARRILARLRHLLIKSSG